MKIYQGYELKMFAPDDNGTPAVVPDVPVVPAPEVKVDELIQDSEALADLSDKELEEFEKKLDVPEKDAVQSATPAPETKDAPVPATETKKFAGKYETPEALIDGVVNATKVLKVNQDLYADLIEQAKTTKDFGLLEKVYARLNAEIGKAGQNEQKSEPSVDTPATVTQDEQQALVGGVASLTLQEFERSDLGQEMTRKGIRIPTSPEEVDDLVVDNPYYAMMFRVEFKGLFDKNMDEARKAVSASKTVGTHEKSVIDSDTQEVKNIAQKYGVTFTDAEIQSVVDSVKSKPYNYDIKYGQRFLRQGAIREAFVATNHEKILSAVRQKAEEDGRTQATKDLAAAHSGADRSISTVNLPGANRSVQPKINTDNIEEIEAMTDEQLEKLGGR